LDRIAKPKTTHSEWSFAWERRRLGGEFYFRPFIPRPFWFLEGKNHSCEKGAKNLALSGSLSAMKWGRGGA
jgi:hypothetical protein